MHALVAFGWVFYTQTKYEQEHFYVVVMQESFRLKGNSPNFTHQSRFTNVCESLL